MSRLFSDVLPEWPLDEVEAGLASATGTDVLRALELAEAGQRLSARDFMALVSPAASPHLEDMARIARQVTLRQFGRAVQLFTPLYLANYCTNREALTLADPRVTEYLSGREIAADTAADGWCCVTVDGCPMGGGKVSGGRVKNHYPKALRLL